MDPSRPPVAPTHVPIDLDGPLETATPDATETAATEATGSTGAAALRALETLPVAGFTRRRVAIAVAALVAAWVVLVFVRQVSEAAAATSRAEQAAADNAKLRIEVGALQGELALVQRPAFVQQQARAYGLGDPKEVPFGLAPDAPAPEPDAPGSAAQRLGSDQERRTPLESWLDLLFGPGG